MYKREKPLFAKTYESGLSYIKRGAVAVTLRSLNITNKGAEEIAAVLTTNDTLQHLDLGKNKIGDAGVKALAEALEYNYVLEELFLSSNLVGASGAEAIAESLKTNNTLVKLSLAYNCIGPKGVAAFHSALLKNTGLNWLKLEANNIGEDSCRMLVDLIGSTNKHITSLDLDENNMAELTEERLAKRLTQNIGAKEKRDRVYKENLQKLVRNGLAMAEFSRCRLFIVGQGCVGKTATVRSLLSKPFNPNWDSTLGAEIKEAYAFPNRRCWSERTGHHDNTTEHALRIASMDKVLADSEGQKHKPKQAVTKPPSSNLNEERRQKRLEAMAKRLNKSIKDLQGGHVKEVEEEFSLLNKDQIVNVVKRQDFSKAMKIQSQSLCFNIWDFGGQDVFYTLHHLFLTKHGIYVFVFDLREISSGGIPDSFNTYFRFWLSSINLHAVGAPIFLVGTFADEIKREELQSIEQHLMKAVPSQNSVTSQLIKNKTMDLSYFPIDNKSGVGVPEMASAIMETARSQDYVHRLVSLRWMKCLDEILAVKDKAAKGEFDKMAKERKINRRNQGFGITEQEERARPPNEDDDEFLPPEFLQQQRENVEREIQNNNRRLGRGGRRLNEPNNRIEHQHIRNNIHNEEEDLIENLDDEDLENQRGHDEEVVREHENRMNQIRRARLRQNNSRRNQGARRLVDVATEVAEKTSSDWVTLGTVKMKARECGIFSTDEVDRMLLLFHEHGMIVHITATEALRNIVTVQPQWLIDAISKVIRDREIHRLDEEEIKAARLESEAESMFENALVSPDLLEFL